MIGNIERTVHGRVEYFLGNLIMGQTRHTMQTVLKAIPDPGET